MKLTNFKIILLILIPIVLNACQSDYRIEFPELYAKWIETEESVGYTSDQIHTLTITKDGKYHNKISTAADSALSFFNGTYKLDKEKYLIKITNDGYALKDMTLKKLTESEMIVEITEEFEGSTLLYFSK
ncbi:hypothetical protein [Aquimarina longa]|uniref:hypothetical protein n=1 Tax=Aquimarina longa TaxID=1080221 RepID=UPI0007854B62|nr:hypothetical protein [Aquimarina longa]